ncbi:hypothetical protein FXO38_19975 [Capsicum annuum]|nr:hypothetical protein FXO38_19975 [Capsicum annuum]
MDTQTKNPNCQSDEASTRYGFDCPPQEIVVDIASRLPITSLRQFYFVQKSFYNLSRDPELVNLHISRAVRNDPCIIISMDCDLLYFLEFSDLGMHFVYNPFTRDWCELSQSAEFWGHTDFVFGFGFSPTTNEYKVILIVHNRPEYHCKSYLHVLNLGSNSWRRVGEEVYHIDPCCQGIMVNGKMHWLTLFGYDKKQCDRLIVSFDLADEIFGEVPIVNFGVDPRIVQFQLVVFGDCITVAITLPHENGEGLDIWVMRECNVKESWIKEFIMLGKAIT